MMKGGIDDETMAHTPVRPASCYASGSVQSDTKADERDNSLNSHQCRDNQLNYHNGDTRTDHDDSHNCNHGCTCDYSDRNICNHSGANRSADSHAGANRSADSNTGSDNCTDNL